VRGIASALLGVENEVNLLDMEASIEHLARGTPGGVDCMLVVVEPYYRAMETAGRIVPLAKELGITRLLGIANKVRDTEDSRAIRDYCRSKDLDLAIEIPFDDAVRRADRQGHALIDDSPDSATARAVADLAVQLYGG
jgi:CO dehydrogenase maturation factor